MNIIVVNKYKDLIYSTNIEILKEMSGVFKVDQIANSFNSIFYKKIIIDATALAGFPKENVLKELASSFDPEKLILFLPPDNPPPKSFLSFLVSLNIFNFTDNINGLVELVKKSNSINDVRGFIQTKEDNNKDLDINNVDNSYQTSDKIILGINSLNDDIFATELVYMMKKNLEEKYGKQVLAIEINKNEFRYFNSNNMLSTDENRISSILNNSLNYDIILIDLNNSKVNNICTDIIYLLDPSLYKINKLLYKNRNVFLNLKGKKVLFVNSLLKENDVNQFSREANISVYYNLSPLNDRIINENLNNLLAKLGIIDDNNNKQTKRGLFDIFK